MTVISNNIDDKITVILMTVASNKTDKKVIK